MSFFMNQSESHFIKFEIRKRRLYTSIRNFGDGGEANLRIKGRKISARAEYLGSSQSFWGNFNSDGRWSGKLVKWRGKEKMVIFIRRGKISLRRTREVSKFLQTDSNILFEGGMSKGSKESGREASCFQIKLIMSPQLHVTGFIKHKSSRHFTSIKLIRGGRWNTKGWVRLTGGRFLFSAEMGKCRTSFEGTPRFVPK